MTYTSNDYSNIAKRLMDYKIAKGEKAPLLASQLMEEQICVMYSVPLPTEGDKDEWLFDLEKIVRERHHKPKSFMDYFGLKKFKDYFSLK